MYRSRRKAFTALVLGLAVVAPAASPAFAGAAAQSKQGDVAPDPAVAAPASAIDTNIDDFQLPDETPLPAAPTSDHAPSGVAQQLADWIIASGDNGPRPFMVVDKLAARVFAYDAGGRLIGSAPVLVGLAPGDDSAPGVGDLALAAISPDERTTPAGRFVSEFGPSDGHGTVLWVDIPDSISMHPVITTNPKEHRLQRIRSASPEEHRISFGCINVPAKFYHGVVEKAFAGGGIVYVLPDTKTVAEVFPAFATATDASADLPPSLRDPCADPAVEVPDRLPDPDASAGCALDAPRAGDAGEATP
jgi:hypothetical protein